MEWWSVLVAVLAVLAAILAGAYGFYAHRFSYWRRRGVPHPRPVAPFGNMHILVTSGKGFQGTLDLIRPYRDKGYCGFYMGAAPLLLLWDADMVKQVLCKDFGSFHDRGQPTDEKDPLSAHLFNLSGAKWRSLRNKLSPTFTSGKLKLMLPLIREVADELCAVLAAKAKSSDTGELDLHPILAHFATDVIGTCAFGVQCHCLRDEKNQFLVMSQRLQGRSLGQGLRFLLQTIHPKLASLVPMKWIFPEEHKFFLDLVRDTVEYREQNPEVQRNDFVQLLMQLRDQRHGSEDLEPERHVDLRVPGNMAAQAFIFFIAGLDNVSNTIGYCLTRLAADPALQDEVAAEVRAVSREHGGGEITYEALRRMDLVDRVMMEGLRLWPAIGVLFRKCNATTQVGEVLLEEGAGVMVLTGAMHLDEAHYPEPQRFDPGRHTAEAREQRHPYSFLPFGEGPRICIAERFAKLEMRLALAVLVRDFVFTPGPGFEQEVQLDPKEFLPRPKNGFRLCVRPRVT